MEGSAMELVRALDEQLADTELSPQDQEAVAAHLHRMQQLRQVRMPSTSLWFSSVSYEIAAAVHRPSNRIAAVGNTVFIRPSRRC